MPIPKFDPKGATSEEIIAAYLNYGWTQELEFDWIEIVRGEPHLKRYRFRAAALPCSNRECVQYQLTFVQLRPTGVMKSCGTCGQTEGPITTELGVLLSDRGISNAEAWKIINETNQQPPIGLDRPSSRRRVRVIT